MVHAQGPGSLECKNFRNPQGIRETKSAPEIRNRCGAPWIILVWGRVDRKQAPS